MESDIRRRPPDAGKQDRAARLQPLLKPALLHPGLRLSGRVLENVRLKLVFGHGNDNTVIAITHAAKSTLAPSCSRDWRAAGKPWS